MPRIRVELPESFPFSTLITLYQSHINYGGHLDNALLLTLVSEARSRFLRSLGYTELDVEGVGIIIADAAVQYKSEAFYGEVMEVRIATTDFNKRGFDMIWVMLDQASQREVARGKTGIVFFDYATHQVALAPEKFRLRMQSWIQPAIL